MFHVKHAWNFGNQADYSTDFSASNTIPRSNKIIDYLEKILMGEVKGGMFHVKHFNNTSITSLFIYIYNYFLADFSIYTATRERSQLESPGMRDAWPIEAGRMRDSFSLASRLMPLILK